MAWPAIAAAAMSAMSAMKGAQAGGEAPWLKRSEPVDGSPNSDSQMALKKKRLQDLLMQMQQNYQPYMGPQQRQQAPWM